MPPSPSIPGTSMPGTRGAGPLRPGRYDEAEHSYRKALALDPYHARTHQAIGTDLHATGRYPEAVQALDRALDLDPGCTDCMLKKGLSSRPSAGMRKPSPSSSRLCEAEPDRAEAWSTGGAQPWR